MSLLARLFLFFGLVHYCNCPVFAQKALLVEVDEEKLSIAKKLTVFPGHQYIVFHLPSSGKQTYMFRMYDSETTWNHTKYPIARYTRLDPGSYSFQAKVVEEGKSIQTFTIEVIIKGMVWDAWWFWPFVTLMCMVFFCTVFYFFFLYDLRQKMKVEEIRQRIAADLHDEVGANLSSITFLAAMLSKKIMKPETGLAEILDRITRNSKESSSLINDTIWALNPQYDSFEKLTEKMRNVAVEFLSMKDIALSVESFVGEQKFSLSLEQRRNIYLIFKEIINNIVKHAEASKVWVTFVMVDDDLHISVKDNGVGFDQAANHAGNGLRNYAHRSRNGEIGVDVNSGLGAGTTITILVKLKNHQNW